MPRRTPTDLASSFSQKAEAYRVKALVAADPILRAAINLRDDLASEQPQADSARLLEALMAFVDGRTAK